jgi:DNA-binding HxlR family transcriptional regulator
MQEHRLNSQTRQLIIDALRQTPEMTRTQIARAINRKKSPHLTTLLNQMVEDNILQYRIIQFHNGVSGYTYSLTQDYLGETQL